MKLQVETADEAVKSEAMSTGRVGQSGSDDLEAQQPESVPRFTIVSRSLTNTNAHKILTLLRII